VARIAIDARVITGERDGVGRYARGLVPALAAAAPDDEFLVLRHPSNLEPLGAFANVREVPCDGLMGRLVEHHLRDHRRLRAVFDDQGWPDVFHSLFHVFARRLPALCRPRPAIVLTLHDLIWIDQPFGHGSLLAGAANWVTGRVAVAGSLQRADSVIAVSHATASRAARFVPAERLTVVHHGVDEAFRQQPPPPLPPALRHLESHGRPWIAAMASPKTYKNVPIVVRAFAAAATRGLDAMLVLIGQDAAIERLAASLGVRGRVVVTGEVDDEALRALVGRAALFVHPSRVEGFGMPVVEAMALGTPTAVADVPALTEVGGDGVVAFDPEQPAALARIMGEALTDPAARQAWSARARARAAAFEWSDCARATLDVYASAVRALGGGPAA
jgi:glycosyltransferase involved in cell wall biosynthesis